MKAEACGSVSLGIDQEEDKMVFIPSVAEDKIYFKVRQNRPEK